MSRLDRMPLREAISIINKLYESFGLKSMILLRDNEWINLVTVITLTRRTVKDLSNEYRLLEERLGKLDYDNFKIIIQARPIEEFNDTVTEIGKGYLKIGDLHTKLLSQKVSEFINERITRSSYVLRVGEYTEYDCYGLKLDMEDTPINLLSYNGISASELGVQNFNDLSRSWLGLERLETSINVHLIIPIYATVTGIQYKGGNEINATLKMHQRFLDESKIWVIRKGPGDYAPILERSKYDVRSCEKAIQDGFIYVSLIHNFSDLGSDDVIIVDILHDDLGLLEEQIMRMRNFTKKVLDPFSQTFTLFDAGKKIEEHLLNPRDDEDFVAAFSWLLEMIDIQSIRLGRDEVVRENKTQKGSADIIAYDSNSNNLLAIDCTLGVPSEPKIDRIKNTADYISRMITFSVKAVIVTSRKSPAAKDQAKRYNVKMLDNTDLEELIGFYKRGKQYLPRAKRIVLED